MRHRPTDERRPLGRLVMGAIVLCGVLAITTLAGADDGVVLVPVPPGWQPSLAEVIEAVEDAPPAGADLSQRTLVAAAQRRADLHDAELFLTYVRLARALDGAGRDTLAAEQQQWLAARASAAAAAVVSTGGTLAPLEYAEAYVRLTIDRGEELRRRLAALRTQR